MKPKIRAQLLFSFLLSMVALFSTDWGHAQTPPGNPANGQRIATTCTACHGAQGISNNSEWPNLAGQKAGYLVLQLKAFKHEQRKNPLMVPQAKNLSDSEIEDLAAYFSSLPACETQK